ncbi:MAG: hypothetical protein AAFR25_00780 [Cyanobacteria bacterium J06629_19]
MDWYRRAINQFENSQISTRRYIHKLPQRMRKVNAYMLALFLTSALPAAIVYVNDTMRNGHFPTKDNTAQFFVTYPDLFLASVLSVAVALVTVSLEEHRLLWQKKTLVISCVSYVVGAMYLYAQLRAVPISTGVQEVVDLVADVILVTHGLGIVLPILCILTGDD